MSGAQLNANLGNLSNIAAYVHERLGESSEFQARQSDRLAELHREFQQHPEINHADFVAVLAEKSPGTIPKFMGMLNRDEVTNDEIIAGALGKTPTFQQAKAFMQHMRGEDFERSEQQKILLALRNASGVLSNPGDRLVGEWLHKLDKLDRGTLAIEQVDKGNSEFVRLGNAEQIQCAFRTETAQRNILERMVKSGHQSVVQRAFENRAKFSLVPESQLADWAIDLSLDRESAPTPKTKGTRARRSVVQDTKRDVAIKALAKAVPSFKSSLSLQHAKAINEYDYKSTQFLRAFRSEDRFKVILLSDKSKIAGLDPQSIAEALTNAEDPTSEEIIALIEAGMAQAILPICGDLVRENDDKIRRALQQNGRPDLIAVHRELFPHLNELEYISDMMQVPMGQADHGLVLDENTFERNVVAILKNRTSLSSIVGYQDFIERVVSPVLDSPFCHLLLKHCDLLSYGHRNYASGVIEERADEKHDPSINAVLRYPDSLVGDVDFDKIVEHAIAIGSSNELAVRLSPGELVERINDEDLRVRFHQTKKLLNTY